MKTTNLSQSGRRRGIVHLCILITTSLVAMDLGSSALAQATRDSSRKGTFRELPPSVQNAVRGQAGNARVEDIDIVTRQGQTNYNVAFKRDGKTVELWLDSQGNLLDREGSRIAGSSATGSSQARAPLAAASKIQDNQLPKAVRETVEKYAQGARIEDIDKGTFQGKTVYEVAFKRNNQHVELRVAQDGSVVRDDVNDRFLTSIGERPGGTTPQRSWSSVAERAPLRGSTKISFRDVPQQVRDTVRTYSNNARIEDVEKGIVNGQTVYQAAFKHNDENVELRVAEDGSLVRDSINQRFLSRFQREDSTRPTAAGRGPSWQAITGGETSESQLSNARRVSWDQLPSQVQRTLRTQAGPSAIENLSRGTLDGKTVYQGAFTRDGEVEVLRVTPEGRIVR